jgi:hypothetical protein
MNEPPIPNAWRVTHPGRRRRRARQPNKPRPAATTAIASRCQSSRNRIVAMTVAVPTIAPSAQRNTVPAFGWRPGRLRAVAARVPATTAVIPASTCAPSAAVNTGPASGRSTPKIVCVNISLTAGR